MDHCVFNHFLQYTARMKQVGFTYDTFVPNFRNRKTLIIFPKLPSREEDFCAHFFLRRPVLEEWGRTDV
jgi:hypothetical protein